ncbi:carbohydrate ABC transporter permease [Paenibacillus mucilaginosus]|uniref:Binding-protein-dependent transport systems inner membrane component n=3 Tax=Paenibacillus mucilaginosus TaxID=61624 RepID=H6N9K7_9BACL|nr:carbohydrate ABC transporter permease [Paenibacillus mucilaginosus]AEI42394.1 binding-protein-dependent transport systems inner membrane component [Paenibacillus mucilaginosus KNP414]AFC28164.1 binding-protein-dependent transport systems inner membrane component [Paenibacillus mucilaginosus 3016]AFH60352.1 sugar ABC transporter permease [Paenibacillus mucilaginosus K02]WFA16999.1 carbohydrate ABC transporter permease [Paenibacillus mucilaginosus]
MKTSLENKAIDLFSYLFMAIFSIFCIVPFILLISSSLSDEKAVQATGFVLFPKEFSLFAYKVIFQDNAIFNAYKTTIIFTVLGTVLCLILTSAMAYALSVKTFTHRNKIAFFVYFTMLFNGGLIPSYLLIAKYLGLRDNILVYILPVLINPFNMFLLRNFFKQIPDSLAESAKIDGANDIYILYKIILPLAKPALATIGLFYGLGFWNEWFTATLYIDNKDLYSLQYLIMKVLREVDFMNQMNEMQGVMANYVVPTNTARMATAVVTVGPIIFVYPFIQKYFVKGLVVGAVKG